MYIVIPYRDNDYSAAVKLAANSFIDKFYTDDRHRRLSCINLQEWFEFFLRASAVLTNSRPDLSICSKCPRPEYKYFCERYISSLVDGLYIADSIDKKEFVDRREVCVIDVDKMCVSMY